MGFGFTIKLVSKVAIVGGGLAGLVAAHTAIQMGLEVALIEASSRLGGRLRSHHVEGFVLESGLDGVVGHEEWLKFLGLELLSSNPQSHQLIKNKVHPVGEGLPQRLPNHWGAQLTVTGKLRLATERFVAASGESDEELGAFIRRRLGDEAWPWLEAPLAEAHWAQQAERLSVRAAFPELWAAEGKGGLLALKGQAAPEHSLPLGMGQLTETLLAALDGKVEFGLGLEAVAVTPYKDMVRWAVITKGGRVDADAVVLALPLPQAAKVLRPLHPQATTALNQITQLPMAAVYVAYKSDQLPEWPGPLLLTPELRCKSVLQVQQKWPGRAPEGFSLLRLRFVGETARQGDQELSRLSTGLIDHLAKSKVRPLATWVYRQGSHPQFTSGHLQRVRGIERAMSQTPGLYLAQPLDSWGVGATLEAAQQAIRQAASHIALSPVSPPAAEASP